MEEGKSETGVAYLLIKSNRSKAILQQARLQAEISLQKREEEEKKLKEEENNNVYDSDDLDKRLSKYIGTYELPKAKIMEEEGGDGEGKDDVSEDFEDYKKRLGLNLSLEDDDEEDRVGSKTEQKRGGSDSERSLRDSHESTGEIKGYKDKWNDSEAESEKEYKQQEKEDREYNKEEVIMSDHESDHDKRMNWESDAEEKIYKNDGQEENTIIVSYWPPPLFFLRFSLVCSLFFFYFVFLNFVIFILFIYFFLTEVAGREY